jgi:colanic acid/amylovoran biosynthesis glycosyltransferase
MNVIISQALASGLPVITTRHSGLPEQVIDGENGFLVNEGDYEALAERILYMIEHPEIWAKLGRFGRLYVEKNYNSKVLIERQVSIYERLIKLAVNNKTGK